MLLRSGFEYAAPYNTKPHTLVPLVIPSQLSPTQFYCCDCERDFKDENALNSHLRLSKAHRRGSGGKEKKKQTQENQAVKGNNKTWCSMCKKKFKKPASLSRHMASVRHNPLCNIECIADAKCQKRFNCPSGQLQHLESGTCVSGMTKAKLDAVIAINDPGRIITSVTEQWLLEENSSATSTSQTRSPILTPTSTEFFDSYPSSVMLTPTSTLSNTTDFHSMLISRLNTKHSSQKCPLCPASRIRKFRPHALRDHLSSSVHAQVSMPTLWPHPVSNEILFHCPYGLMGEGNNKPIKQFSTISGLAQHLESGACGGGKETFRRVVGEVEMQMMAMGFSGLKLLD
ncbi:hypothetical protein F5884DRAFT_860934 [Xylogone sp. PMI_703]|nr:hypothetical protein F5884DRAFT_860934 [Xylogone sp. PMI_703]